MRSRQLKGNFIHAGCLAQAGAGKSAVISEHSEGTQFNTSTLEEGGDLFHQAKASPKLGWFEQICLKTALI